MIQIEGNKLVVETQTLSAVIDGVRVESLVSKADGQQHLFPLATDDGGLELVYRGGAVEPVVSTVRYMQINDYTVDAIVGSWKGDGVVRFAVDPATGELLVQPSAYSARTGVRAVRWKLGPAAQTSELVAPFFQGVKLPLSDPLVADTHWPWPMYWEAGLAILAQQNGGLYVYCQDDRFRYKALRVPKASESCSLAFDTEAYAPWDTNLAAGGLTWRINVYAGHWSEAVAVYRSWLWQAYESEMNKAVQRPDWVRDVSLAVSWCPLNMELLHALRRKVPPEKTILHVPRWREDPFDENYPEFTASRRGATFIAQAQDLGYHVMPHCNSIDIDPVHPIFQSLRDFVYRDPEQGSRFGWSWVNGAMGSVPDSNKALMENRDSKVMVKIHPGLSMWRLMLRERVAEVIRTHKLHAVFTDVTLCTGNIANGHLEDCTSTEGMRRLLAGISELDDGIVVAGEGRNEITAQVLAFGQVHLYQSLHESVPGLERIHCDLGTRLYGDVCRGFGYSRLNGSNETSEKRFTAHAAQGVLPTLTLRHADEVTQPNPAVKRALEQASDA